MASFKTFLLLLLVLAFLTVAADAEPLVEVGNEAFGVTVQSLEETPGGLHARLLIENLTRSREVFLHLQANATDAQDYFFLPGTRHPTDTVILPMAPGGTRSADVFFKLGPASRPGVLAVGEAYPPFDQIAVSLEPVLERQAQALIAAARASRPSGATLMAGLERPAKPLEGSQPLHQGSVWPPVRSAGQRPLARPPGVAMVATALAPGQPGAGSGLPAARWGTAGTSPPRRRGGAAARPQQGSVREGRRARREALPAQPEDGRFTVASHAKTAGASKGQATAVARPGSQRPILHRARATATPAPTLAVRRLVARSHPNFAKATPRPAATLLLARQPEPAVGPPRKRGRAPAIAPLHGGRQQPPQVRPQVIFLPPGGRDHVIAVYAPPTRRFGRALILWAGHQGADGYGWYRIRAEHPDVQESQIGYAATYPHQIWTDGRTYLFVRWDVRHGVALVLQVAGDSIISAQWATYDDLVYWLGPGRIYPRLIYQGGR